MDNQKELNTYPVEGSYDDYNDDIWFTQLKCFNKELDESSYNKILVRYIRRIYFIKEKILNKNPYISDGELRRRIDLYEIKLMMNSLIRLESEN